MFTFSKDVRIESTVDWLHMHPAMVSCRFVNLTAINCQNNYSTTMQSPQTQTRKERRVRIIHSCQSTHLPRDPYHHSIKRSHLIPQPLQTATRALIPFSIACGLAPTTSVIFSPFLKNRMVGIARMPSSCATSGTLSTSTL